MRLVSLKILFFSFVSIVVIFLLFPWYLSNRALTNKMFDESQGCIRKNRRQQWTPLLALCERPSV
jgi:hypothetical protein